MDVVDWFTRVICEESFEEEKRSRLTNDGRLADGGKCRLCDGVCLKVATVFFIWEEFKHGKRKGPKPVAEYRMTGRVHDRRTPFTEV